MIRFWEFIAQRAPPLLSWVVGRFRVLTHLLKEIAGT
jgi:hypothetical protein